MSRVCKRVITDPRREEVVVPPAVARDRHLGNSPAFGHGSDAESALMLFAFALLTLGTHLLLFACTTAAQR